jgi:WD repeat-containing protein mio
MLGLSDDGINLLQRYVDKTGDVQTAAVVAVHCVPESAQLSNAQITSWIVAYQDLLDMWRLWNQRLAT